MLWIKPFSFFFFFPNGWCTWRLFDHSLSIVIQFNRSFATVPILNTFSLKISLYPCFVQPCGLSPLFLKPGLIGYSDTFGLINAKQKMHSRMSFQITSQGEISFLFFSAPHSQDSVWWTCVAHPLPQCCCNSLFIFFTFYYDLSFLIIKATCHLSLFGFILLVCLSVLKWPFSIQHLSTKC